MADLRTWAFQSPRRLALVVGTPIVILLAVGSLASLHGNSNRGTAALSTDAGASPSVKADVPDAQPFVTAAVNFVRVWARLAPGQTPSEWHSAVRALATPELATALDLTDPASLPDSSPSGDPTVRFVTSTSALISVGLSNGTSVIATVVTRDHDSWLVDDIEPDTGN